jgi:hypothetical protein
VNAIGNVLPPFFIFPRVKYNPVFVENGPAGSDGDSYPSGWMTAKSFVKFMKHFIKYSHASKENPVLLILDNHESHVSADVIRLAKENGVTLLTLPPHCSNKLQPLDITALNNWMLSNPGKTVTIYNIPTFVSEIMSSSFSQANIVSGFKNSGIHPFNSDIFEDEGFLCSAVTDRDETSRPLSPESPSVSRNISITTSSPVPSLPIPTHAAPSTSSTSPVLSTSRTSPIPSTSTLKVITPKMIKPFRKALQQKTTRRGRQPGKTKILTKTPEKLDVPQETLNQTKTTRNIKTNIKQKAKVLLLFSIIFKIL